MQITALSVQYQRCKLIITTILKSMVKCSAHHFMWSYANDSFIGPFLKFCLLFVGIVAIPVHIFKKS